MSIDPKDPKLRQYGADTIQKKFKVAREDAEEMAEHLISQAVGHACVFEKFSDLDDLIDVIVKSWIDAGIYKRAV